MSAPMNRSDVGYADEPLPDFSAELKNVCDDVVMLNSRRRTDENRGDGAMRERRTANRNISQIISRIKDEGAAFETADNRAGSPALDEHRQHNGKVSRIKKPEDTTPENATGNVEKRQSTPAMETGAGAGPASPGAPVQEPEAAKVAGGKTLQYGFVALLVLTAVAVSGLYYRLDRQSAALQDAMQMYQQALATRPASPAVPSVATDINRLDQTVAGLKQAVNKILAKRPDSKPVTVKKRAVATDAAENNHNPRNQPAVAVAAAAVNGVTKKAAVAAAVSHGAASQNPPVSPASPVMFTVNLASFSDRGKAQSQLSKLHFQHYMPVIEEARVNNKKIYRLSVEGFSTREEASQYVQQARRKFGFKGWIRQG